MYNVYSTNYDFYFIITYNMYSVYSMPCTATIIFVNRCIFYARVSLCLNVLLHGINGGGNFYIDAMLQGVVYYVIIACLKFFPIHGIQLLDSFKY